MITERPSPTPRRARAFALCFAAATLMGLIFSAQLYSMLASRGARVTWADCLRWGLAEWYLWAALFPLIFWVSRRSPLSRAHWIRTIGVHLGAGAIFCFIHEAAYALWCAKYAPIFGVPPSWGGHLRYYITNHWSGAFFEYLCIVVAWYAFEYASRFHAQASAAARLEAQLLEARLDALRMQLHPHFLFNSLNSIAALIPDDPRAAEDMTVRLSEFLRLVLDTSGRKEVPLVDEAEFVRKYLEIQQIRFGPRLRPVFNLHPDTLDLPVPTFILQPIVENAVKHAMSDDARPCIVEVTSRRDAQSLILTVDDSGPGLGGLRPSAEPVGRGLSNCRDRLQEMYGSSASLTLTNRPAGGCSAVITLPCLTPDSASPRS